MNLLIAIDSGLTVHYMNKKVQIMQHCISLTKIETHTYLSEDSILKRRCLMKEVNLARCA